MLAWRSAITVLLLIATGAEAYGQRGTEKVEFWPEMQLRYGIDDATSATLMSRLRQSTGPRELYRAEQSLTFNHDFAAWLSGGVGFQHGNSTNAVPFEEERLVANQVLRVFLPDGFRVDFRTQEEFRWLLQGFSVRLRERAEVLRKVQIDDYSFTPFASAEVFWDSRFGEFSRYRLTAGATLPVYRAFSVQPYFMREDNYAVGRTIHDVFGLILMASF